MIMVAHSYPHHLLVLVHGRLRDGGIDHLSQVPLVLPQSGVFQVLKTHVRIYTSLDWDAEKVVQEILATLHMCKGRGQPISDISFFGFNVGGLVARFAIGLLYQMDVFQEVKPRNFDTFGTPHIGLPMPRNWVARWFTRHVYSPLEEQLICTDNWEGGRRPLLDVMSDTGSVFYRGLALFESVRVYANAIDDGVVPYVSAAIEATDSFVDYHKSGIMVETYDPDGRYPALVKSWSFPPNPRASSPSALLLYMCKKLWTRATVYAVLLASFLVVIGVLALATGAPFPFILCYMTLGMAYAVVPASILTLLSLSFARLQTRRLVAERQRLLDVSKVFAIMADNELSNALQSSNVMALQSDIASKAPPLIDGSQISTPSVSLSRYTPVQHHAIANLNALPQLHKELVWRKSCLTPHRALIGLGMFGRPKAERAGALWHWGDGLLC